MRLGKFFVISVLTTGLKAVDKVSLKDAFEPNRTQSEPLRESERQRDFADNARMPLESRNDRFERDQLPSEGFSSEEPSPEKFPSTRSMDSEPMRNESSVSPFEEQQQPEDRFTEPFSSMPRENIDQPFEQHMPMQEFPQVQQSTADASDDLEETINTIEAEDEGNWLLKRVWWEQAEDLFGQIIQLNDRVMQLQVGLINQRSNLDKTIDQLFKSIGIEQASLQEILAYVFDTILPSSESIEIAEEKTFYEKINTYKNNIESVRSSLQTLEEQDRLLSEAMVQLMGLVNECRNYESTSWKNFKEIGRILNDEKAKTLFYEIDAAHKNIQSLLTYIQAQLTEFVQQTTATMQTSAESIVQEVKNLKEADVHIEQFVTEHKELLEKKKIMQEQAERKQRILEEQKKKKLNQGFFASVLDWFGAWFTTIKKFFGFGK